MGQISIKIEGSFPHSPISASFSADEGGHAMALKRAAAWVLSQMPPAIQRDHKLHTDGVVPGSGFGRLNPVTGCGYCGAVAGEPHTPTCSSLPGSYGISEDVEGVIRCTSCGATYPEPHRSDCNA